MTLEGGSFLDFLVVILLDLAAVASLLLLWREGLLRKPRHIIAAAVFLCAAFCIRAFCLDTVTSDYTDFLSKWVAHIRAGGGFPALSQSIGNYNLPYLYILAVISYFDISPLHLIKLCSIFFDVLLAWSCMKLVGVYTKSGAKRIFAFIGTLLLPTVIMNGALWGQCDSIYVSLAMVSLYLALRDRPILSMVFIALSFSFKLQAVFIMPVFAVFLYTKRMKIWHLLVFPVTYVVTTLPAVIAGRPFIDTLMLYINQAGSIGSGLNYNSPSVFSIIRGGDYASLLSNLGISAALLFTGGLLLVLFYKRRQVTDHVILPAALLLVIGIPFLLPRMHDRYFFFADVLSFALCIVTPRYLPVPVLCSFASLLGYHAFLKRFYILPMSYGGFALIIALVMVAVCVRARLSRHGGIIQKNAYGVKTS